MLLPHVLPHAKRVYQQLRSLTRRVVVDSGGISGALHLCHGSGRCHQDENIFFVFTFDILWFCMLYIVFCFGGALRVTGQVDVITGEREVHERAHRSITDPRSPSNCPEILN